MFVLSPPTVKQGKTLLVSNNGINSKDCGQYTPCHSVEFALSHRADENDIIKLMNSGSFKEPFIIRKSLDIFRNLTLLGVNGRPTISALNPTFLFENTERYSPKAVTLHIRNIIFKGIGILGLKRIPFGYNISFEKCHFESIIADRDIFWIENSAGYVKFHQCKFIDNNFQNLSRAISITYSYSVFKNCHFVNNNGCIALIGGNSSISSSIFEKNAMYGENMTGGAISAINCSAVQIVNSSFNYNTAFSSFGQGGAITLHAISVSEILNSRFIGNEADRAGGAVGSNGGIFLIKGSSFHRNSAQKGGAVSHKGKELTIESSSFRFNSASELGGAIFASSSFENNGQSKHYGSAINIDYDQVLGTVTLVSLLFQNNVVFKGSGGAIAVGYGNVKTVISSCTFTANRAIFKQNPFKLGPDYVGGGGGAIDHREGELLIKSSLFTNNTAIFGGAIAVRFQNVKTEVLNSTFERNQMGNTPLHKKENCRCSAGAINVLGKELIIEGSSFHMNGLNVGEKRPKGGGGAIYISKITKISRISNCNFTENYAYYGGAIICFGKELYIETSRFEGNLGSGSASYVHSHNAKTEISNCVFRKNKAPDFITYRHHEPSQYSGAIDYNGKDLLIEASKFHGNSATLGGAIYTGRRNQNIDIEIKKSIFKKNSVIRKGGAILFQGKRINIDSSVFQSNTALKMDGLGVNGEGGALYLLYNSSPHLDFPRSYSVISNCTFKKNKASFRGGAIIVKKGKILIKESTFWSSSYYHDESYIGGEHLYSYMAWITLEYVSFKDGDSHNFKNTLIFYYGEPSRYNRRNKNIHQKIVIKNGVNVTCLHGKYIETFNTTIDHESYSTTYEHLAISCSYCYSNLYSITDGHLYVNLKHKTKTDQFCPANSHYRYCPLIKKTHKQCYNCPLGGVCEKGKIRSSTSSWGYISQGEIRFITCPFGYCCDKVICRKNYDSCNEGRTGILCGKCVKGYTENLMTPDCLPSEACKHHWLSMVVMIAGIAYLLVFMFISQTLNIIKAILIPNFISQMLKGTHQNVLEVIKLELKKKCGHNNQIQYMTNDINVEEQENQEMFRETPDQVQLLNNEEILLEIEQNVKEHSEQQVNIFPGLLKILIFFYQTLILLKVFTESRSNGPHHITQEIISSLFNLRVDGIFTQDLSWCPIDNLHPVPKTLIKTSFVFYLFSLIIFVLILLKVARRIKVIGKEIYDSNKSRLLCCTLRFLLIGYAGITVACFSLLSCVKLGPLGNVLFIDGSISCYKKWQMVVFSIICIWIIPFPIAIYAASRLLYKNIVSTRIFLLCLLFPIPTTIFWLSYHKKAGRRETEDVDVLDDCAKDALDILEGPFRNSVDGCTHNIYHLSWESIYIGRRLVLICIKTFVINTFIHLLLMSFFLVLFLCHHIYVKPFRSNFLNNVEVVSLLMLIAIGFLNLTPAYNYTYPSTSYIYVKDLIKVQQQIESVLILFFPVVVGLCAGILTLLRLVELLYKFGHCIANLIIFTKQKLS